MAREKDLEKEVDGDAQSDGASGRVGSVTPCSSFSTLNICCSRVKF